MSRGIEGVVTNQKFNFKVDKKSPKSRKRGFFLAWLFAHWITSIATERKFCCMIHILAMIGFSLTVFTSKSVLERSSMIVASLNNFDVNTGKGMNSERRRERGVDVHCSLSFVHAPLQ